MAANSRLKLVALAALMVAFTGPLAAQDFSIDWNPRSGDVWVDHQLEDINRYGSRYREPFVDEMVRYYGAPRALVNELLTTRRWAPGDVYYACAIAQALGRPCRYVADEWDRNRGKGWGVVASELGIKPGSAEFHRLKSGIVPTYDRWARPITIDRDLRKDFPGRGTTGKGIPGSPVQAKPAKPRLVPARSNATGARPGGKAAAGDGRRGQAKGRAGKPGAATADRAQ